MSKSFKLSKRILAVVGALALIAVLVLVAFDSTDDLRPLTRDCGPAGFAQQATQPNICK